MVSVDMMVDGPADDGSVSNMVVAKASMAAASPSVMTTVDTFSADFVRASASTPPT